MQFTLHALLLIILIKPNNLTPLEFISAFLSKRSHRVQKLAFGLLDF